MKKYQPIISQINEWKDIYLSEVGLFSKRKCRKILDDNISLLENNSLTFDDIKIILYKLNVSLNNFLK